MRIGVEWKVISLMWRYWSQVKNLIEALNVPAFHLGLVLPL